MITHFAENYKETLKYNSFQNKLANGYSYPIYLKIKYDDKTYLYIREYLISRKENKYKSAYPNYIIKSEKIDNEKKYLLKEHQILY